MRARKSASVALGLIVAAIILWPGRQEAASPTLTQVAADLATLQARVTTLEGQVRSLQTTVSTQAAQITSLQTAVSAQAGQMTSFQGDVATLQQSQTALQDKLQFVTVAGTEMYITGANLNVRNGLGATDVVPNGLGNLIVGYNENDGNWFDPRQSLPRSGSHNIVVGRGHGYSSFGGLVVGLRSLITAPFASVSGGFANLASADHASVSGGQNNVATGFAASVSGGRQHFVAGSFASVSGGVAIYQDTDNGWSAGAYHTP